MSEWVVRLRVGAFRVALAASLLQRLHLSLQRRQRRLTLGLRERMKPRRRKRERERNRERRGESEREMERERRGDEAGQDRKDWYQFENARVFELEIAIDFV